MVAKVVKNTKLLTLSSIILIKFKHRSGKWTILLRHIFWEQKAKKKKKKKITLSFEHHMLHGNVSGPKFWQK